MDIGLLSVVREQVPTFLFSNLTHFVAVYLPARDLTILSGLTGRRVSRRNGGASAPPQGRLDPHAKPPPRSASGASGGLGAVCLSFSRSSNA